MNFSELLKYIVPTLGAIIGFLFLRLKSAQKGQATAETKAAQATYTAETKVENEKYEEAKTTADSLVNDYAKYSASGAIKPGNDSK